MNSMNKLKCVILAFYICSIQGNTLDEKQDCDVPCIHCTDFSDSNKTECLCRTYTFAFYGQFGLDYWNKTAKQPAGPTVEVVKKVCEMANRDCKQVFVPRSMCSDDAHVAPALNGRWYDVCGAIDDRDPRPQMYAFPKYGYMTFGNFLVLARPGSNITEAMIRDIKNDFTLAYETNLGFLSEDVLDLFYEAGYYIQSHNLIGITSPGIAEQGNSLMVDLISKPECDKDDDDSETADLIIHLDISLAKNKTAQDFTFVAELEGQQLTHSLMFRADDKCIMSWWDEAYQAFICSDGYLDFCQGLNAAGGNRWNICQNQSFCMD